MTAQQILTLAEQVAISVQSGSVAADYHEVEQEMIRRLWGLTADQQTAVTRLARRGRIPTNPAEEAVLADTPEWAATVRLVLAVVEATAKTQACATD